MSVSSSFFTCLKFLSINQNFGSRLVCRKFIEIIRRSDFLIGHFKFTVCWLYSCTVQYGLVIQSRRPFSPLDKRVRLNQRRAPQWTRIRTRPHKIQLEPYMWSGHPTRPPHPRPPETCKPSLRMYRIQLMCFVSRWHQMQGCNSAKRKRRRFRQTGRRSGENLQWMSYNI